MFGVNEVPEYGTWMDQVILFQMLAFVVWANEIWVLSTTLFRAVGHRFKNPSSAPS